jgi:hypothetical protein
LPTLELIDFVGDAVLEALVLRLLEDSHLAHAREILHLVQARGLPVTPAVYSAAHLRAAREDEVVWAEEMKQCLEEVSRR